MNIAVVDHDPRWRATAPRAAVLARRAAAAVFDRLGGRPGLSGPLEATIVLADDALSRELNQAYRGQDRPTNVLSFADIGADIGADEGAAVGGAVGSGGRPPDQPRLLGDVVLARQTLVREAAEQGKELEAHLAHLVVHGVLHLLGYDHEDDPQADEMETLEVAILADLGVADPYEARP